MNKINFKKIFIVISIIFLMASSTFAITFSDFIIGISNGLIKTLGQLAIGFAVVFFFWGVFMFVLNADDAGKREEGKQRILWSIVAIFVMVSVWALVSVISNTTNLDQTSRPTLSI